MVSRSAPRELERYVFSPGGRSDSRDHGGGGEGLPEEDGWAGPKEWSPWGDEAGAATDDITDSRKEDIMVT